MDFFYSNSYRMIQIKQLMMPTRYSALSKSMMFKTWWIRSPPEVLLKKQLPGPHPRNSSSVYFEWSPGMSFLRKILVVLMQQDFNPLQKNDRLDRSVPSFHFILFGMCLGPSGEVISFLLILIYPVVLDTISIFCEPDIVLFSLTKKLYLQLESAFYLISKQ